MKKKGPGIFAKSRDPHTLAMTMGFAVLLLLMGCLAILAARRVRQAEAPQRGVAVAPEVSAGEAVPLSYFDDAVFIGNSRTKGVLLYSGLDRATFYTDTGLTVRSALTDSFAQGTTLQGALSGRAFGKVYVMLGLNELGWQYPSVYQDTYRELIEMIRAAQPHAVIYLQGILPVSASKEAGGEPFTLARIAQYNELVRALAAEYGCWYLTPGEAVCDDTGHLPEEAASDGVHLTKSYCQKWLGYLRTHTVPEGGV